MYYYRVSIKNYNDKEQTLKSFRNKHFLKEYLRTLNNAYIEVEMNKCIETFYIKQFNQDIWIEI